MTNKRKWKRVRRSQANAIKRSENTEYDLILKSLKVGVDRFYYAVSTVAEAFESLLRNIAPD